MNDEDRHDYVREVTAAAAPDARLLIVEFIPGGSRGVPGIEPSEVAQRFTARGRCCPRATNPHMDHNGKNPGRFYLFARARLVERGDGGDAHLQRRVARAVRRRR